MTLLNERLWAWKRWYSTQSKEKWDDFNQQRKITAKIIRGEKRKYDKSRLEKDFQKNKNREFYWIFKEELQQYQPPCLCFKRKDGILALNKENRNILAKYSETLLNCEEPQGRLNFEKLIGLNQQSNLPSIMEISRSLNITRRLEKME